MRKQYFLILWATYMIGMFGGVLSTIKIEGSGIFGRIVWTVIISLGGAVWAELLACGEDKNE